MQERWLAQRRWFITRVNSGFGREMAEQFLARGDVVAGTVRQSDSSSRQCKSYGRHGSNMMRGAVRLEAWQVRGQLPQCPYCAAGRVIEARRNL